MRSKWFINRFGRSASVGRAHADPGVANLLVMHHGIVERDHDAELGQVQLAHGSEQGVGGDHPVVLSGHQRGARLDESLLRSENVERGALTDPGLFAYAVERDLGGSDLSSRRKPWPRRAGPRS